MMQRISFIFSFRKGQSEWEKGRKVSSGGGVAVFLFAAGIRFLTKLSDPGYAYSKNRDFIEHSDSYDVLFFGNSHMANGVFPMELWNDYGIVSYNLAGFGLPCRLFIG